MHLNTHPFAPLRRLALLAVLATAPLLVQAQYFTRYTVTTDLQSPPITHIVMLETDSLEFDSATLTMTRPFVANGYGVPTVLNNPFESTVPMQQSLLLGIVRDLPFDAPGQEHLVLMMDPVAASNAANIAWGTIFTSTLEEDLLAAVRLVSTNFDFQDPTVLAALDFVFDFGRNIAPQANLGPNGLPGSAWFATGGAFTVMAWSDAQVIGSGFGEVTVAVPEPGSWALMGAGLGVLVYVARRRRT